MWRRGDQGSDETYESTRKCFDHMEMEDNFDHMVMQEQFDHMVMIFFYHMVM